MSTVVQHTTDHRGMTTSRCPRCRYQFIYWDADDLDENGDLLCYCDEELVAGVDYEVAVCSVCGLDQHTPEQLADCLCSALAPLPEQGCDLCPCGCKYWDGWLCFDCGERFRS